MKKLSPILFIGWLALILAAFFVTQRPSFFSVAAGLGSVLLTVGVAGLFVLSSAGIGYWLMPLLKLSSESASRLLLSTGLGMGLLGLSGFGLAAAGLARGWLMIGILLIAVVVSWRMGKLSAAQADAIHFLSELIGSIDAGSKWVSRFALAYLILTFVLALAPPFEAFDGLFYHLVVPTMWIRDGGLRLVNIPHYWFPSLLEGMFVWPLSLGLDSAPQLLHLTFALLSVLLIWDWSRKLFDVRAAWWGMAVFLCMPSLGWLASWAYTDFGLVFYTLAALLAFAHWKHSANVGWLSLSGIMSGFAVGVKYTSFILPLVILALIFIWLWNQWPRLLSSVLRYGIASLLTGFAWYLRNWVWTGNPVYPFVFGGPFWDSFRTAWYSGADSGIGWNPVDLFMLPLVTTLGYKDANYFDGRFGPLFLILLPVVIWWVWMARKAQRASKDDMTLLLVFSAVSMIIWTVGVVQTDYLFQARLLWPGLIPLVPFLGGAIVQLESLDTRAFRVSFIFSTLVHLIIVVFLLDFFLLVSYRNPIIAAIGSETRQSYVERFQPKYAQALELVNQTPPDAFVYLINEPRSYGMNRRVQPDPINDNLSHDFYIYRTNADLISAWKSLGYTHVLVSKYAFDGGSEVAIKVIPEYPQRLEQLITMLGAPQESTDGDFLLFTLP